VATLWNREMGNILNLVFDNWEDEKTPLPNLNHLNSNGNNLILPFYVFVLMPPEIKLNLCKPEEIDKNGFYYYFIHFNEYLYDGVNWEIPQHIEDLIREKNLRIVFYNEHESYTNPKKYYNKLVETVRHKKLNEELFYIVNNSSELYDVKNSNISNINVFKTNYLIELVSKYVNVKVSAEEIKNDKKFLFLCHNARPKPHRVTLLTLLNSEGLLSEPDLIDWSLPYGVGDNFSFNSENFEDNGYFNNETFNKSFDEIKPIKKISYFEKNLDWFIDHNHYDASNHISIMSHNESYINIITESHFSFNSVHITEKSFKPFYYFQIPLFVATARHIEYLKKEHDLYLFDDLIDHSYDKELDMVKRLNLLVSEIKRLSKLKNEIQLYYKSNKDKLIHNHNYIRDHKNKKHMDNFFISLCNNSIPIT
jgi:hypothetical protein